MTIRAHRLVAAGALAIAAVAAPLTIALSTGAGQAVAGPACLAWYGSQADGVCLSYSNGNPTSIGTPWGAYGPNSGIGVGGYNGGGIVSGPLLPGHTYTSNG
ncbi:MAG: hypothetical protein ABW001_12960 [Mycobacterium sp.]